MLTEEARPGASAATDMTRICNGGALPANADCRTPNRVEAEWLHQQLFRANTGKTSIITIKKYKEAYQDFS